jgi:TolB-like protein/Tfp pilus assembly protein PilF
VTESGIGRIEALWATLQRRKVVQWVMAYGLFAWGLLQGIEYLSNTFGWPPLLQQLATLAFIIGLPIVLVVAWYHGDPGVQQATATEFLILFGLLSVGGALFWWFGSSGVSTTANRVGTGATAPAPDRSIAVLPFDNLSGDPANGFLGDGLAEELANLLTRVPDLEVASRTSAFSFKDRKMAICEIAAELGVKYLVEGSLRRHGDTLAITAQLVDCPRGTHAWSNTYRRRIAELPSVEDDITGSVVEALKIMLAPETLERMRRRSEVSQDAYESYLQAVSELRNYTDASSLDRAVEKFQEAISGDPTYAEAYAGLCEAHVRRFEKLKTVRDVGSAEQACSQAVRLDRGRPEVHNALGTLYVATGQNDLAEREFREAITLDPGNVEALLGLGTALKSKGDIEAADRAFQEAIRLRSRYWRVYGTYGWFLFEEGRWPAAIVQFRRGVELAPQNAQLLSNLGGVLFLSGDFNGAAEAFRRSVEIAPTSAGYSNTGTNYCYAGQYGDAVAMFEQAIRLSPEDHQLWGNLGDAYHRMPGQSELARGAYAKAAELVRGTLRVNPDLAASRTQLAYYLVRQGEAALAVTELETAGAAPADDLYSHYYAALIYEELGKLEAAIAETLQAVEGGYPATLLRADPEFAVILRDPRVAAVMEAAGGTASPQ